MTGTGCTVINPPKITPILEELLGDPQWQHALPDCPPEFARRYRLDHDNTHFAAPFNPDGPLEDDARKRWTKDGVIIGGIHGGGRSTTISVVCPLRTTLVYHSLAVSLCLCLLHSHCTEQVRAEASRAGGGWDCVPIWHPQPVSVATRSHTCFQTRQWQSNCLCCAPTSNHSTGRVAAISRGQTSSPRRTATVRHGRRSSGST